MSAKSTSPPEPVDVMQAWQAEWTALQRKMAEVEELRVQRTTLVRSCEPPRTQRPS